MSDTLIYPGGAVKRLDDGRVAGYLVRFSPADGSERDLDGEYFTASTNLGSYASNGTPIEVYIDHGQDPAFGVKSVGTGTVTMMDAGAWFEAQLEMAAEYEEYVKQLVDAGKLGWSSGAATHLVRKSGPHIENWPVIEASLTTTPAEPRNIAQSIKAAKLRPLSEFVERTEAPEDGAVASEDDAEPEAEPVEIKQPTIKTTLAIDAKELVDELEKRLMGDENKTPDPVAELAAQVKALTEAFQASQTKTAEEPVKPSKPEPSQKRPVFEVPTATVAEFGELWQYDHYDAAELDMAVAGMKAFRRKGQGMGPSQEMVAALAIRLQEDYQKADFKARKSLAPIMQGMKNARIPLSQKGVMQALKANELMHTTGSNAVDEWIGVAYSGQLWDRIRYDSPVLSRIPVVEVPQGAESFVVGTLDDSVTWYKAAEATAATNPGATTATITSSKLNSGQTTFSLGKLSAMGRYSQEVTEDAFLPFVSTLRMDMEMTGREYLEAVAIDADSDGSASTNVNDIAGTPASTDWFLVTNGFRKLALVTNTANSRDGGAITVEDFLETLKLMGLAGREALDRNAVSFVLPVPTHYKILELAEIKTRDVFSAPTLENGVLTNIFGYDVIVSANMHKQNADATYGLKANSAGKLDLDTASNNTTGSILAVRWDQWKLARKGGAFRFVADYDIDSDSWKLAAHLRVGMGYRSTEAAAISYNLTL